MEDNPFAPPRQSEDPAPDGGMVFSAEGAAVVASLATWMRALSLFLYLGAALVLFGSCAVTFGSGRITAGLLPFVLLFAVAAILVCSATWLRSAGSDFERGVLGDDEAPIGQGFRNLRAYLILFGIIGILQLCWQIYLAVAVL
jgi:hypothetical protein